MGKREVIKTVASFGASFAVSGLVTMLIKSNAVPANFKEKVYLGVGSAVLSGMIGDKSVDYVGDTVDKIFDMIDSVKKPTDSKYVESEKIDSEPLMNDILDSLEEKED